MKVEYVPFRTPYINTKLAIIARLFMQKGNEAKFFYVDYKGNLGLHLSVPTLFYLVYYIQDGEAVYLVRKADDDGFKRVDCLEAMQYAEDCIKEVYEEDNNERN